MEKIASEAAHVVYAPTSIGMQAVMIIFAIVIGSAYWFRLYILLAKVKRENNLVERKLKQEYVSKSTTLPISLKCIRGTVLRPPSRSLSST